MDEETEKRVRDMMNMVPDHWDKGPMVLASEVKRFLMSVADHGTGVDSGGGDGLADLWVTVDGIEYYLTIRKSNGQLTREGKLKP